MSKKGFVEPETVIWSGSRLQEKLSWFASTLPSEIEGQEVRIIREKDYQRLLKLAKKGAGVK